MIENRERERLHHARERENAEGVRMAQKLQLAPSGGDRGKYCAVTMGTILSIVLIQ